MQHPKRTLVFYSLLARIALILFLFGSAQLGQDDESPTLHKSRLSPLLRWDAFHFTQIALEGYNFEQQWAFLPALPLLLKTVAEPLQYLGVDPLTAVLAPAFLVLPLSIYSTTLLYDLTLAISSSPDFAFLTGLLSIFPPSPVVTHFSIYNEPFFNFFSYAGMLHAFHKRWLLASLLMMAGTAFRSNGILLAGFPLWGVLLQPLLSTGKLRVIDTLKCTIYVALIIFPFVLHQYHGWSTFCNPSDAIGFQRPDWCNNTLPLIYGHVQAKYWNVGFLKYWTISQIPNFLITVPVIGLLYWSGTTFVLTQLLKPSGIFHPMFPHAVHALVLTTWIFFAAHVQILLRLAPSMPFFFWSAAKLTLEHPKWGKAWVYWTVIWGACSIVLWAAFLPPA